MFYLSSREVLATSHAALIDIFYQLVKIEMENAAMHEEDKNMTISPVTHPSVSGGSLSKRPAATTGDTQELKQNKARFDTCEISDEKLSASESGIYHPSENEPEITQCTTNTDQVDAEIKKLREEKRQIIQQLKKADENADKQADLERRLAQLDAELQAKDNDAYRKQHANII